MGDFYNRGGGALTTTSITSDDLEIDSGTLSIDATNNRVGMGTTVPGTQLQVESTAPYVTLKNDTSENSAGGCESKMIFEDHGNNALGQIEVSHAGSSDDEYGQLIIKTNNDSGLQTALTISEAQAATFAGDVKVDGAGLKIKEASAAPADTTAYGQLWVKDEAPCELYFTTDAGDDIQLTDGTSAAGGGGGSVTADDSSLILHMQMFT